MADQPGFVAVIMVGSHERFWSTFKRKFPHSKQPILVEGTS